MKLLALLIPLFGLLLACSGDGDDSLTIGEALEEATGQELDATEVNDLLSSAEVLCGLTDEVLEGVWAGLNDNQLGFQDFVFSNQCPERLDAYSTATGRLVDAE